MVYGRLLLKCLGYAVLGALPGVLLAILLAPRVGISVAMLGAFVAAMLAIPGTSPRRVLKLTAALIAAKNLPHASVTYDWVDEGEAPADATPNLSDALMQWIMATDVTRRRGWLVASGLVVGLVAGGALATHDVLSIGSVGRGLVLPFDGAKDSPMVQGVLLTLATATWGGVLAALVGAPAYRRPLLVAVPFAAFIATMIGFAVSNSRGGAILGMVAMFASAAALVAMLVAACGFEIEEDDNAPIDLETEEGVNRFFRRLRRDSEEYFDACEKRSWLGRYGLHVLFYSLFMAGAGISIFATSFSSMRTARQSRYWPAVDGVVTAVIARHEPDGNGIAKYHGRAVYQYTVNGTHYSADIMDFRSKPRHHGQFNATQDVPFDPGDSVRVYYNPNAPEEAVLVTGADPIQSAIFTAACVMAVLGMVGFTISAMYFLSVRARKAAYLSSRFGPGQ